MNKKLSYLIFSFAISLSVFAAYLYGKLGVTTKTGDKESYLAGGVSPTPTTVIVETPTPIEPTTQEVRAVKIVPQQQISGKSEAAIYIDKMLPLMEDYTEVVTNLGKVNEYLSQGNLQLAAAFLDSNSVKLNNIFSSAQRIKVPDEAQLTHSYFLNGINELRLYVDIGSAVAKYGSTDAQTRDALIQMEVHRIEAEKQSMRAFQELQNLAHKYGL